MGLLTIFGAMPFRQWSWPLWLPVQFFGIFPSSILVDNDTSTPWADELEQKIFSSAVGAALSPVTTCTIVDTWCFSGL